LPFLQGCLSFLLIKIVIQVISGIFFRFNSMLRSFWFTGLPILIIGLIDFFSKQLKEKCVKIRILFLAIIFIFGMGPGLAVGEIYQWVDKDGVHHFTNEPPPPGATIVKGTAEFQPDEPTADTDTVDGDGSGDSNDNGGNSDNDGDDGSDNDGDDGDDGVGGDEVDEGVVVGEPYRRYPEEIPREADRDAGREEYRDEGRLRPEEPRRRR
jgi:hypothetical protein